MARNSFLILPVLMVTIAVGLVGALPRNGGGLDETDWTHLQGNGTDTTYHRGNESDETNEQTNESTGGGVTSEGITEEYILAWEAAEQEKKEHGGAVDPHTDAQEALAEVRERLAGAGVSESKLQSVLGVSQNNTNDETGRRRKRLIVGEDWIKGIVPYVYDTATVNASDIVEIERAMSTVSRFTCVDFVPWKKNAFGVTTNDELALWHHSFLKFVSKDGCWSFEGNIRSPSGSQGISCCPGYTCIHELGHALGLRHEQHAPIADRDWIIRINEPEWETSTAAESYGYDLMSLMHYHPWTFATNGPTFTTLFPELKSGFSHYYLFMEVSIHHQCAERDCNGDNVDCENDGYYTVVDGKCQCRCVQGLDPDTRCTTVISSTTKTPGFPGGRYGLPELDEDGCPNSNFGNGSITHYMDGEKSLSSSFDIKGRVKENEVVQNFCITETVDNGVDWPKGAYCIYRKGGTCPEGFKEGYVQFENSRTDGRTPSGSGALPDGSFEENTKIEFCCMQSGFENDELFLPSRKPFALVKHPKQGCHAVRGMHPYTQSMKITGNGLVTTHGDHPVKFKETRAEIGYCLYKPAMVDCGGVYALDEGTNTVYFESPSGSELECTWHFKAPEKMNLMLTFEEFDVPGTPGKCGKNVVRIQHYRPGHRGEAFCGKLDQSFRSINNTIRIRMSTYDKTTAKIKGYVTLLQQKDLSYRLEDRGTSYAGKVNVTRFFEPCVPWSEVSHCEHHQAVAKDKGNVLLEGNYCRNPDYRTGIMPWCYYQADGCLRNYCDVSQKGTFYDTSLKCNDLKMAGLCTDPNQVGTAWSMCALTCKDSLPQMEQPVPSDNTTCPAPDTQIVDGELEEQNPEKSYPVGSIVTYKCSSSDMVRERVCLTSGKWSPMGTACDVCLPDWTFAIANGNRVCLSPVYGQRTFSEARDDCHSLGGELMTAKTAEENALLGRLASQSTWLPITDSANEGTWVWDDGTVADFTNWGDEQPDNWYHMEHCAVIDYKGQWNDLSCQYREYYICKQQARTVPPICADFSDKCETILNENVDYCADYPDFAKRICAKSCGTCNSGSTATCNVPIVQNADIVGDVGSVPAGQLVEYVCQEGYRLKSKTNKRMCLSSGTLTRDGVECLLDCPEGWTFSDETKSCYKFFDQEVKYEDAVALCADFNASVAGVKTESQSKFVKGIINGGETWIGLSDRKMEGVFQWEDGTILAGWTIWDSYQPDDRYGQDCTIVTTEGKWQDVACSSDKPTLCEGPLGGTLPCVDHSDDCPSLVTANPGYCAEREKTKCVYTCGSCKREETPKCVINNVPNAWTFQNVDELSRGQVIDYTCNGIYGPSEGDVKRICLEDGSLSGQAIVCDRVVCQDGWSYFAESDSCYKYFDGQFNYEQAKTHCLEYNGFPAMMKTELQIKFVQELMGNWEKKPWIGLVDKYENRTFVWEDGSPLVSSRWKENQPDNAWELESCVIIETDKQWNDRRCSDWWFQALCQVRAGDFPVAEGQI